MRLLELVDVYTYYGESLILEGISMGVEKGSVVALLGRNGMGKTTTANSIIGYTPPRNGEIYFNNEKISGLPPHKIARKGIGLVPQGRFIFPSLSVEENLTIAARPAKGNGGWTLEKAYSVFPLLKERAKNRGTSLSGGEQQMLCIARALLTNPDFLVMDEPSEGLAPLIVRQIGNIVAQLKSEGFSVLLIEQNLSMALKVADYVYILSNGQIAYQSTPQELKNNRDIQEKLLAVTK